MYWRWHGYFNVYRKCHIKILKLNQNSIGTVTISREKEKNSLDIETSEKFMNLVEFDNNNSINCIVIEGNSKIFSPGADIKELNELNSSSAKSGII